MKTSMLIHPSELSKKWIDKLVDAGVNTLGLHPVGGKASAGAIKALVDVAKTKEYRDLIDYAKARGLEIEYELHSASYLMPRELFVEHPEYFRVNKNGQRTPDWNFCVSNQEALELFANNAASLANDLYGSSNNYYFWMDDGKDFKCRCEKCQNLSMSDQQMIALNAAIAKINENDVGARLAYLAYMDTLELPENVSPNDGIFLEYAPFEKYTAKGENAGERIDNEKRMLTSLIGFFGKEHCKVLEYWYDNSLFSGWKKPPKRFVLNRENMQKDINEYAKLGFENVSTFACYLGEDYEELYGDVDISDFFSIVDGLKRKGV